MRFTLLVALLAVSAHAAPNDGLLVLTIDKELRIVDLLEDMERQTGVKLDYDPSLPEVRQTIGTGFSHEVPLERAFDTYRAILAFFELHLVPLQDNVYRVVRARSTSSFVRPPTAGLVYEHGKGVLATETLRVAEMAVDIRIDGFRARIQLDFVLENGTDVRRHGTLDLRLPRDAIPVSLAFGAKEARVVPSAKAAQAYAMTVARIVDPALLEWSRDGVFRAHVFPLLPKTRHRMRVAYVVNLPEGECRFDLPARVRINGRETVRHVVPRGATLLRGGDCFAARFRPDVPATAAAWRIVAARLEGGHDLLLAGRPSAVSSGQTLLLVGRGRPGRGEIVLTLAQEGRRETVRTPIANVVESDLAPGAYGQATADSETDALRFGIVGKWCSLLMLETEEEYERNEIERKR